MNRKSTLILIVLLGLAAGAGWLWNAVPLSLDEVLDSSRVSSDALFDRNGVLFHARLSKTGEWSLPIDLAQMGKWLPLVAVAVEDGRFRSHGGVDFAAILRAAWQNATSQKIVSGASTITSQVIRITLSEKNKLKRNIKTKIIEFVQAMKLESALSKDKILEIYLNRAPFGGNIRGVEAAARAYFGKSANNISPGEACLLIGMLVAPTTYRPDIRPRDALRRRNAVIAQLEEKSVLTREQAQLARLEQMPSTRRPLPFRAYHYAVRFFENSHVRGKIETGLDLNVQTSLENALQHALSSLPSDITASGGIIDNNTNELVAWVGNARLGQRNIGGVWVDCGTALRSPGSALKPFAWLTAFDSGKLTPSSLLADTPLAFSGRAPRNFDLTYKGAVSARVALADSLNAPAARVFRLAGADNVLGLMRSAGLSSLNKSASYYGDSLILGGCEVRLFELLDAYSVIANGGDKFLGSRFERRREGASNTRRIFSPGAAWLVSDILSDTRRLSFVEQSALQFEGRRVAFKTGTSYNLRDAWTVAWTPDFTTTVWFGNPSGTGWSGLVGLNIATPPAFRALRQAIALSGKPSRAWFETPIELERQKVCALSGKPPTGACPVSRDEWVIRDVTSILPCDLHTIVGGRSVTNLPTELDFISTTETRRADRQLSIVSPLAGARYIISSASAEQQKIPLRAEGGYGKLFWFADGVFAGEGEPTMPFFQAFAPGEHTVSVIDSRAHTATTTLNVITVLQTKDETLELR